MTTRSFLRDESGASAAEFGLVLPLLLLFLFGIIDAGRWLWEYNRAEKATQAGARFAIVSDPIPGGLAAANYVGVGGLTQGDIIPASAFGKVTCTNTACTCTTNPCPTLAPRNATAFTNVVTRMRGMMTNIGPANVTITYEGSGLGYAGDPNGMDISPLVTVELSGLTFRPITTLLLLPLPMPNFRTSLTSEDANGLQSN
jgi:hypothetical protein